MTVIVTKTPGGVTQLFNTETGRVTYKCKAEFALMPIDAFGGIVKFNRKGAMATVTGHLTTLEFCNVIKKDDPDYNNALIQFIDAKKEFVKAKYDEAQQEIHELEKKLPST